MPRAGWPRWGLGRRTAPLAPARRPSSWPPGPLGRATGCPAAALRRLLRPASPRTTFPTPSPPNPYQWLGCSPSCPLPLGPRPFPAVSVPQPATARHGRPSGKAERPGCGPPAPLSSTSSPPGTAYDSQPQGPCSGSLLSFLLTSQREPESHIGSPAPRQTRKRLPVPLEAGSTLHTHSSDTPSLTLLVVNKHQSSYWDAQRHLGLPTPLES